MASNKIHLHIENTRNKASIYHITHERWDAACKHHRGLAGRLHVTIGWDGDIIEGAPKTADILVGVPARRDSLAARAPRLRWIHSTSAGVDGFLPFDWLPPR